MITEHNLFMTYAYVLALTAHHKSSLTVLDYGGNLGYYYWIGKTLLPDVALEYHCKELPAMVEKGRALTPQVIWHSDDSCLDQQYDLVVFNASFQYIKEWQEPLRRAAATVRAYCFLTRVATVERIPSYLAIQRFDRTMMLHQQLNRTELLSLVASTGLRVVREFLLGSTRLLPTHLNNPLMLGGCPQR